MTSLRSSELTRQGRRPKRLRQLSITPGGCPTEVLPSESLPKSLVIAISVGFLMPTRHQKDHLKLLHQQPQMGEGVAMYQQFVELAQVLSAGAAVIGAAAAWFVWRW